MYEKERDEKYYDIGSPYLKNTMKMEPPADYGDNLKVCKQVCYFSFFIVPFCTNYKRKL
jgi:hypothetical protein